jgi:hypothetical protein
MLRLEIILVFGMLAVGPAWVAGGLARDSWIMAPGGTMAWILTGLQIAATFLGTMHIALAVLGGGRLANFVRPLWNARAVWRPCQAKEFGEELLMRWLQVWRAAAPARHLYFGLVAFAASWVWLLVPMMAFMRLETAHSACQQGVALAGSAGLVVLLGWLPIMQARLAGEERPRAMFEPGTARELFRRAPGAWFVTCALQYAMPILLFVYSSRL